MKVDVLKGLVWMVLCGFFYVGTAVAQEEPVAEPPAPAQEEEVIVVGEEPAEASVGYKSGFFIESADENFKLKINGRVQGRYTFENIDLAGDEFEQESAFAIQRARLKLGGHVFSKNIEYKLQLDFGKGGMVLKDAYADFALVGDALMLRIGQYKKPFSRQQMTSSSKLELVDRAITDGAFGAGRDIGLMFHNETDEEPIEWAVGVFNGTGDKPWFEGDVSGELVTDDEGNQVVEGEVTKGKFNNVPDKFRPMAVARIGYNHGGIKGYSEADLEGGPLRFAAGLSAMAAFDYDNSGTDVASELDFIVKAHGFSSTGGAYVATASPDGFGDLAYQQWGFHVQAGHVIGQRFQPVVRYAMIDPDGGDNNVQEILGGLSVYLYGHNLKWQTDGGVLIHDRGDDAATNLQIRTQLQLAF